MEDGLDREGAALSLNKIAESLKDDNLDTLLQGISKNIQSHADIVGKNDKPTIITSRFMPAQQAYDEGVISCGAISNISSDMLKHLGYEVKLVHGQIPTTPTHAWISVKDQNTGEWQQYDLTRKDAQITPEHHAEFIIDDWNEIKDVIENVYKKNNPSTDL